MDVSVVAAVGSFFMSERVLKPKATVLLILGCILIYDLTSKTHDVASLRVYRGPALMAFTLMMVAYSLRTWRRNGVACDELLFLPGTPHGETVYAAVSTNAVEITGMPTNVAAAAEGDVAAGLVRAVPELDVEGKTTSSLEMTTSPGRRINRGRTVSEDSSLSSIREFANSWDDADDNLDEENVPMNQERMPLRSIDPVRTMKQSSTRVQNGTGSLADRSMHAIHSSTASSASQRDSSPDAVDRFRENHPRITYLGSFFFFRSSSTSTQNAAYAPSGPSVVGAALDLSMPILFNFHLFIEAFNHYDAHGGSETPAKILPLIFLSVLIVRTTIPPGRRGRFWSTMSYTFMAPFHTIRFRDAFIGDVLTSLARPLQDIVFALAYYVTVIYGMMSAKYGLSDSGRILESSHILHHIILPSCSLMPLWWRFLQSLREAYDTGHRWPHLGNAFKYLTAALVVLYGMSHPEERYSVSWILCFTVALLYQIWWDTVMDWELFVLVPSSRPDDSIFAEPMCCRQISSVRPNSYILLALQRNIFQPIRDLVWYVLAHIPSWKQIQLRPCRLYKTDGFYWRIFAYNTIFRATWMLCYIPSYHLDAHSFKSDTHNYMGVVLPVLELLRRTFWGFLLLEIKTIHMMSTHDTAVSNMNASSGHKTAAGSPGDKEAVSSPRMLGDDSASASTFDSSKHGTRQTSPLFLPNWLGVQAYTHLPSLSQGDGTGAGDWITKWLTWDDEMKQKLFVTELATWAVAFIGFGLWATS